MIMSFIEIAFPGYSILCVLKNVYVIYFVKKKKKLLKKFTTLYGTGTSLIFFITNHKAEK